jgi:IS4 transposase
MKRGAVIDGEIRIGDRNYARAGVLRDLLEARQRNTDFIVRMSWRTFALSRPDGQPFNLIKHLEALPDSIKPHEVFVHASTGRAEPPLKLRLIISRKSPQAAAAARRKLPRAAQRKQKKLDPRTVVAAGFLILATSLPTKGYSAKDIYAAYRLRWQIELAFKRLKSLLHIDQLPTRTPPASRSWLLAHLILALLCDDVSQEVLESFP